MSPDEFAQHLAREDADIREGMRADRATAADPTVPDDLWRNPTFQQLTAEDMRRAVKMIAEDAPTACVGGNSHVVGPHDLERAATAVCACCGKWVVVKL